MLIHDAAAGEGFGQFFFPKLWKSSRSGKLAHVGQRFDAMFLQQADQFVDRACRMPDGPDLDWRNGHGSTFITATKKTTVDGWERGFQAAFLCRFRFVKDFVFICHGPWLNPVDG